MTRLVNLLLQIFIRFFDFIEKKEKKELEKEYEQKNKQIEEDVVDAINCHFDDSMCEHSSKKSSVIEANKAENISDKTN